MHTSDYTGTKQQQTIATVSLLEYEKIHWKTAYGTRCGAASISAGGIVRVSATRGHESRVAELRQGCSLCADRLFTCNCLGSAGEPLGLAAR